MHNTKIITFLIFCFCIHAEISWQSDCEFLSALAQELDTDKGPHMHNYTEIYAQHFAPLRSQSIRFLEIGIGAGNSVLLWEQYFPNAELHFIDNDPRSLFAMKSERTSYHLLDQEDRDGLEDFASKIGGDFDIIIDDGGHYMHQQIISFQTLFPHLKGGGLYIVEDLHTSYWQEYGGRGDVGLPKAGDGTAIEFLKNLVEDLDKNIHSIHFYKSLCIIQRQ